jgi:hypothetical protein
VLQKVLELPPILGPPEMIVAALSVLPIVDPLALIAVSLGGLPDSKSIFPAINPLSFESLPIVPCKPALTVPLSIKVLSSIDPIFVLLAAFNFNIFIVVAFVYLPFSNGDTSAMSFMIIYLPEVDPAFFGDYVEVSFLNETLEIEVGIEGLIVKQIVTELFLLRDLEQSI